MLPANTSSCGARGARMMMKPQMNGEGGYAWMREDMELGRG